MCRRTRLGSLGDQWCKGECFRLPVAPSQAAEHTNPACDLLIGAQTEAVLQRADAPRCRDVRRRAGRLCQMDGIRVRARVGVVDIAEQPHGPIMPWGWILTSPSNMPPRSRKRRRSNRRPLAVFGIAALPERKDHRRVWNSCTQPRVYPRVSAA